MNARALALAALWAASPPAIAQSESGWLEISAGAARVGGGNWDGEWSPGPAIVGRLATPAGPGTFYLGLRAYTNDGLADQAPDFTSVHADAGWGPILELPGAARLTLAMHVGGLAFLFDDEDADGPLRNESELAAGLAATLSLPLLRGIRAWAGVDATRVFTRPGEDLFFVEGGLAAVLPAPTWLRSRSR